MKKYFLLALAACAIIFIFTNRSKDSQKSDPSLPEVEKIFVEVDAFADTVSDTIAYFDSIMEVEVIKPTGNQIESVVVKNQWFTFEDADPPAYYDAYIEYEYTWTDGLKTTNTKTVRGNLNWAPISPEDVEAPTFSILDYDYVFGCLFVLYCLFACFRLIYLFKNRSKRATLQQ